MEVNNKFQIGQKVFFLDNGKAKSDKVKSISIFVHENSINIMYDFQKSAANKYENDVFATETDLKAYVFDEISSEV